MDLTAGELIFLDTNILLTATDELRPQYADARNLFRSVLQAGFNLAVNGQVLREYLVAATRPKDVNGLGMTPDNAVHNIKAFESVLQIIDEKLSTSKLLQHLAIKYKIRGKRIHDANIVATMKTHRVQFLCTQNTGDFNCFDEIQVYTISELFEQISRLIPETL